MEPSQTVKEIQALQHIEVLKKKLHNAEQNIEDLQTHISLPLRKDDSVHHFERDEMDQILKDAIKETMRAHGNVIKDMWMISFEKRFWGRIKAEVHNRLQKTKN